MKTYIQAKANYDLSGNMQQYIIDSFNVYKKELISNPNISPAKFKIMEQTLEDAEKLVSKCFFLAEETLVNIDSQTTKNKKQ